ncbi:MAG: hypothetical protein ACI94Y_000128 [Maribacter sp.]|jgi:hypothetical protein
MKIQQRLWNNSDGWKIVGGKELPKNNTLVFAFGNRYVLEREELVKEAMSFYPDSDIIFNSTSGEIQGSNVYDDTISMTALHFEKTNYKIAQANISEINETYDRGKELAIELSKDGLKHVFVISDGGLVNGSELARAFNENLPKGVTTTGGLAGDGARFEKTLVGYNEQPDSGRIVAVGFYGDAIQVGYGSVGGWDSFGARRKVTKSKDNVLYELDGKSALELYKTYLGEKAKELPGSALLFPLSIKMYDNSKPVVRTILSIDEEAQSMTFAGDIPEGATAQLMKANFDKLIDGAYEAAESGKKTINEKGKQPDIAILISCVGRKLVLDQRVDEEVESVLEIIGNEVPTMGFYSYGELSPFAGFQSCKLHNQTMTITLLGEN